METLETRITRETERVSRGRELRAALPAQREKLAEKTHLVNRVEACLDEVSAQLNSLRSFGLGSLVESLFGAKQKKIDDFRAQASEFEAQLTVADEELGDIERQVTAMTEELSQLDGAEAALQALLDEKAAAVVSRGDQQSAELERVTQERDNARAAMAKVEKAAEAGRQLLKHLESLDRAVREARGKRRFAGRGGGIVGQIIGGAVASLGPKSVLRYVQDGLRRFTGEISELPLTENPDDMDLARICGELEAFGARVAAECSGMSSWDQIATLPVEQDVRAALQHLKTLSANLKPTLEALEQQRANLIEAA